MRKKRSDEKLNKHLCPEDFELCVPKDCELLEEWSCWEDWRKYVRNLTADGKLPREYRDCKPQRNGGQEECKPPPGHECCSCDCEPKECRGCKPQRDGEHEECKPLPGHECCSCDCEPKECRDCKPQRDGEHEECKPPPGHECYSCDCKPGWILQGDLAVAHARRVHDKIHRQILGFEQVSAIDVGFTIFERRTQFKNFLAIRIHVNRKRPPEELARMGLSSFTRIPYAISSNDLPGFGPLSNLPERDPLPKRDRGPKDPCCPHPEKWLNLMELLERQFGDDPKLWDVFRRYPISGVQKKDLSVFCPLPLADTESLDDIRLCICGVPIDIINAKYDPSVIHPGGDAERGIFVAPPRRSNRFGNKEQILTGRGRVNPLVGGISIGSVTGQAGTLGAIVWDSTDGTPCVLSNWHVLAGNDTAQIDQPTYQPALFDGGTEDDVVATLKRWHLGEEGDAAIAEISGDRSYASGETLGLWHPISGYLKPSLNLEVRKGGRTTGFTEGFIDGIHLATNIDYGNGVVRYFRDQFHIAPLFKGQDVSQVGDSGSLVVTSFRPVDLDRDLRTIYGWLFDCTGHNKEVLCDEINKQIEELLDEQNDLPDLCEKLESIGAKAEDEPDHKEECELIDCEEIAEILEDFKEGLCDEINKQVKKLCDAKTKLPGFCKKPEAVNARLAGEPDGNEENELNRCQEIPKIPEEFKGCIEQYALHNLCNAIEQAHSKLCRACLTIDRYESCFALAEKELRRVYEECCLCKPKANETLDNVANAVNALITTECPEAEKVKRCVESAKDNSEEGGETDACDCLYKLLQCINQILKFLEEWARFYRSATEKFGNWLKRCRRIHDGEKRCQQILDALKTECESKISSCGDPSKLIKCIKEYLESKESETDKDEQAQGNVAGNAGNDSDLDESKIKDLVKEALVELLEREPEEIQDALVDTANRFVHKRKDERYRSRMRAYYAVGLIFAGDTPGSPFGEFAVASDVSSLAEELRFSLRPVFEPRSSFRELRERPPQRGRAGRALRSRESLTPGDQNADPRGGGPQPEIERAQSGPGSGTGGG